MARRKGFQPIVVGAFVTDINLNLDYDIKPGHLLSLGRGLARDAEELIRDRMGAGELSANPMGTGGTKEFHYKERPLWLPAESTAQERGGRRRLNKYKEVIEARRKRGINPHLSIKRTNVFNEESGEMERTGRENIRFDRGWADARGLVGLRTDRVDLIFSGQLRDEVKVHPTIEYLGTETMTSGRGKSRLKHDSSMTRTVVGMRNATGKQRTKIARQLEDEFGNTSNHYSIGLEVGFSSESSWRIAMYHAMRGIHFAYVSEDDLASLMDEARDAINDMLEGGFQIQNIEQSTGRVRDAKTGQFIPFNT
jgi:hypothetical protein